MNMFPTHYAPHHTGHLPLCGARHTSQGGDAELVICTTDRDMTTCFKCIDQYEERTMTPEQMDALSQARDAIDGAMAEIEEQLLFDQGKRITLRAIAHMIQDTPWWQVRRRHQLHSAYRDVVAFKLSDVRRTNP